MFGFGLLIVAEVMRNSSSLPASSHPVSSLLLVLFLSALMGFDAIRWSASFISVVQVASVAHPRSIMTKEA